MNDLISAMSHDMGINYYTGESDESFIYRVCYSALGQWWLKSAENISEGIVGTTKNNQTIVVNELLQRFIELFPEITERYKDTNNQQWSFSAHIRKLYEQTGYLLTNEKNYNILANHGRTIETGNSSLFFGLPIKRYTVNGLGVFVLEKYYPSLTKEFLIRDELTIEEYFRSKYDFINFNDRDIGIDELQFFNPLSTNIPTRSWISEMVTDYSIARKTEIGPFYRVIRESDGHLLYSEETIEPQNDTLTSYEYRRLYFALRMHYGNPIKASVVKLDDEYSKIRIGGQLPNREYYYLLLMSWPYRNSFDKVNFLIRNEFVPTVTEVLGNIGIEFKGGCLNV